MHVWMPDLTADDLIGHDIHTIFVNLTEQFLGHVHCTISRDSKQKLPGGPFEEWKTRLENGMDWIRFEYCLDKKLPSAVHDISSTTFRRTSNRSKAAEQRANSFGMDWLHLSFRINVGSLAHHHECNYIVWLNASRLLGEVVKRNLDDMEAEILRHKVEPEQREAPCIR